VVLGTTFTKKRAIGAVDCKNEGMFCNFSVGVALKVWLSHANNLHEND